ncbi:sensor histidine kinase [Marinilabilia sp.]
MLKRYLQKISKKAFSREASYDDHFFLVTVFLSFWFTFINAVSNLLIGLHGIVTIWTAAMSGLFIPIFFLGRHSQKKIRKFARSLFFVTVVISLNAMWVYNGGSKSPSPVIFVALMALIIYFNPKPGSPVISIFLSLNIVLLLIVEWHFPRLIVSYESEQQRILDYIVVIVYLFAAVIPTLAYAKRKLTREKEEAEKDNQEKSAYLANMSHEIRTPMNAIVGFTELLQHDGLSDKEQKEYVSIIRQNSELLLTLINDILDLSKLEANLVEKHLSSFSIQSLFTQIYNAHITQARKSGLFLETDLPVNLKNAIIKSDRTLFFQVFSNLITNALKVTHEGDVRFGVRKKKDKLSFFVFDTGPGIPREQQKRIFERFSQLNPNSKTKEKTDGVGLGLSICKAILELLGGSIKLHSEVNKGSTFIFSFPESIIQFYSHTICEEKEQCNIPN